MVDELVPADYTNMDLLKAEEFDRKIRTNMLPAFPAVVRQIIKNCGILEGTCIDIGSGTGLLSIELARQTSLTIHSLEKTLAMFEVGVRNIKQEGLEDRIKPNLGDAHSMPFDDDFADLIVSRGSYHFWEDKTRVFKEILRVLKKGGVAFIGGGFGQGHGKEVFQKMVKLRDNSLGEGAEYYRSPDKMEEVIKAAEITDYNLVYDETGLWAVIRN